MGPARRRAALAAGLARAFAELPETEAVLSLSADAEILAGPVPADCELPVATYAGPAGLAARTLAATAAGTCACRGGSRACAGRGAVRNAGGAGPLMAAALARLGLPWAWSCMTPTPHRATAAGCDAPDPGPMIRRAHALIALSGHVARAARRRPGRRRQAAAAGVAAAFRVRPRRRRRRARTAGTLRLLCFGRLLPYKGLDLLAEALARLGPCADLVVRVVGQGTDSADSGRAACPSAA